MFVGPELIIGAFDAVLPTDGRVTREFDPIGLTCGKLLLGGSDFESFTFRMSLLSLLGFTFAEWLR